MKSVFACSVAFAAAAPSTHSELFESFVTAQGREYGSSEEMDRRFDIFQENIKFIEATNAKKLSYKLGVTAFADMKFEEFRAQYVGGFVTMPVGNATEFKHPAGFVEEAAVDWVAKGAVTPVKNQGHCGSCWTFSTTGALEGAMVVAGRRMVPLSEQELVSCDTGIVGGHGCQGGNPLQALGWVKSNGICGEASDPYECMDQASSSCSSHQCAKSTCSPVLKGGGWFSSGDVSATSSVGTSESDLEAAVTRQPISVAIEADKPAFQLYRGGILSDDACGQTLDHAVLAVGYGVDAGVKYWKVKNSWGPSWGEEGYIRLIRGSSSGYGECGIRHMASFPTVKPAAAIVV